MTDEMMARGRAEMAKARRKSVGGVFLAVAVFSAFSNLLLLAGPLFMLQVYDRVLGSRSEETLVALIGLVAFLYLVMGLLDFTRARVLSRVGARFQTALDRRVFSAVIRKSAMGLGDQGARNGTRDVEAVGKYYASPVFMAFFDIPWTPVFLFGISLFHPLLGLVAVCGGGLLIALTVLNQLSTRSLAQNAQRDAQIANALADHIRDEADSVRSLGMQEATHSRWSIARIRSIKGSLHYTDRSGGYTTTVKVVRLFLQSAILAVGAYLVLRGQVTPGGMIAASILLGRALAPVEQIVNQWGVVQQARNSRDNLIKLLGEVGVEEDNMPLPRPKAILTLDKVTIIPPGSRTPTLRAISCKIAPGQAVGVIGPSGAGKSTLARALTGQWPVAQGEVRLDGATLNQYNPDTLGSYIGYLPQQVRLFEGTIAENISRMMLEPDPDAVVKAAQQAAAHEMILQLPQGYDTPITTASTRLSGGEMQRVGLARALFGDPIMLILDEPNSNLDNKGNIALNEAIRGMKARGGMVLIMAHRPTAIQECDMLLMIEGGAMRAFGPKDEILNKVTSNASAVKSNAPGGVS